jgi:hypothetical protein
MASQLTEAGPCATPEDPLPGPGFVVLTGGLITAVVAAALLRRRPEHTYGGKVVRSTSGSSSRTT